MYRIFIVLAGMIMFFNLSNAAPADSAAKPIDPAKEKEVRKLLELLDTKDMAKMILDNIFNSFETVMPQGRAKEWQQIKDSFKAEEFLEMNIPIYAENFTMEEIKDYIKFFGSPSGSKFVKKMPEVTGLSYEAANKWGTIVNITIKDKLTEAGILNTQTFEQKKK